VVSKQELNAGMCFGWFGRCLETGTVLTWKHGADRLLCDTSFAKTSVALIFSWLSQIERKVTGTEASPQGEQGCDWSDCSQKLRIPKCTPRNPKKCIHKVDNKYFKRMK
jgi:hypothetical protein